MKTPEEHEQLIHEAIDAKHRPTLELYAEHCAHNFDTDHLRDLALAMLEGGGADLVLALQKISDRIERQRAEFMEMEALNRSRQEDDNAYRQAEQDAAFRGAA